MAIRSTVVTVGTTPTPLINLGNVAARDLALTNSGSVTIYFGGPNVTTANGWPIAAGSSLSLDELDGDTQAYACVATGTAPLNVLETGV